MPTVIKWCIFHKFSRHNCGAGRLAHPPWPFFNSIQLSQHAEPAVRDCRQEAILDNFFGSILDPTVELISHAPEGINGVELANAMVYGGYVSGHWLRRPEPPPACGACHCAGGGGMRLLSFHST